MENLQISCHGKLVLTGEIAVLFGKKAISVAVNKKMTFNVAFNATNSIQINSNLFNLNITKDNFEKISKSQTSRDKNLKIIFTCISNLNFFAFNQGMIIDIKSSIPSGLGSSGAVISNFACLFFLLKNNKIKKITHNQDKETKLNTNELNEIFQIASQISIKIYKKYSSYIDTATSIYGGLIFYKKGKVLNKIAKNKIEKIIKKIYLFKIENSKKISTKEALKIIYLKNNIEEIKSIYSRINDISEKSFSYLQDNKENLFLKTINENQFFLEKLGLLDINTKKIKDFLLLNAIETFKISGSGFGDFAFSLDEKIENIKYENKNFKPLKVKIQKGISYKTINKS